MGPRQFIIQIQAFFVGCVSHPIDSSGIYFFGTYYALLLGSWPTKTNRKEASRAGGKWERREKGKELRQSQAV